MNFLKYGNEVLLCLTFFYYRFHSYMWILQTWCVYTVASSTVYLSGTVRTPVRSPLLLKRSRLPIENLGSLVKSNWMTFLSLVNKVNIIRQLHEAEIKPHSPRWNKCAITLPPSLPFKVDKINSLITWPSAILYCSYHFKTLFSCYTAI